MFLDSIKCTPNDHLFHKFTLQHSTVQSGLSGTMVACQPVVPKFVGSNQAEVVGFFGYKKSMARMSSIRWHVKEPF